MDIGFILGIFIAFPFLALLLTGVFVFIIKVAKIAGRKHKLAGVPIAVEQDGKVVIIPASEIPDEALK